MLMKILINIIGIVVLYYLIENILYLLLNYNKYKNIIFSLKSGSIHKIRELSLVKKISYLLDELKISFKIKNINIVSTLSILILSVIIFFITFVITYKFLHLFLSSIILSLFTLFLPYFAIKYFSYSRKIKILKMFPNYVINLKNYTDVNNDIIEAFRRASAQEPLNTYIDKFNISLQKGIKIYDAFEDLKYNINIKKINQFITLLQFCYIYGGNFGDLLDKFSKIQMKTNFKREKERQKIFSSKLVLLILIVLNMYILFGFILTNNEYYDILIKTFIGNCILNINILSYIFIFYMYIKLNSMEE